SSSRASRSAREPGPRALDHPPTTTEESACPAGASWLHAKCRSHVRWELIEVLVDPDLTLQCTRRAPRGGTRVSHELRHRDAGLANEHFFSLAHGIDQGGQLRLGFRNILENHYINIRPDLVWSVKSCRTYRPGTRRSRR